MKLSYIFHSGFVLETEQSILVFDYRLDPFGAMDGVHRNEQLFVPMHFTTGFEPSEQREQSRTCSNYAESRERKSGAQSSWRMKEFTDEKNILFWEISREGETIEI